MGNNKSNTDAIEPSRPTFYPDETSGEKVTFFHLYAHAPFFRFAVFADWHIGSKSARLDGVRRYVKHVKDNNLFWVSLGDLAENNLKSSPGSCLEQTLSPDDQHDIIRDLLEPIKHNCLGLVDGNHEYRTKKEAGISFTKSLAESLAIDNRFFRISWLGCIILERARAHQNYFVHGTHGAGGGGTDGGKLNAALKMGRMIQNVDLHLMGHAHSDLTSRPDILRINRDKESGRCLLHHDKQFYQVCGAGLNYMHSYGQRGMMAPSVREQVICEIGIKRKKENGQEKYLKTFKTEVFDL